jgi:hypothetical protein
MRFEIEDYYVPCVQHALAQRLKVTRAELSILEISLERTLTQTERWQLPSNLQHFTEEELQEQVESWRSLVDNLEWLIDVFEVPLQEDEDTDECQTQTT